MRCPIRSRRPSSRSGRARTNPTSPSSSTFPKQLDQRRLATTGHIWQQLVTTRYSSCREKVSWRGWPRGRSSATAASSLPSRRGATSRRGPGLRRPTSNTRKQVGIMLAYVNLETWVVSRNLLERKKAPESSQLHMNPLNSCIHTTKLTPLHQNLLKICIN